MSAGLLGKASVSNAYTAVYNVTAGKTATANIRVTNQSNTAATAIRVAICPPGYTAPAVPAAADWIEPLDGILTAGGVLEEIGLAMSAGEVVVVFSASPVSVRVMGFEG